MTILQGLGLMILVFLLVFVGSAVIHGVISGIRQANREEAMKRIPRDTNWPPR